MKVIFLDIDGVLISRRTHMLKPGMNDPDLGIFDAGAIRELNRLAATVDAHIVISSSWRRHYTQTVLVRLLKDFGLEAPVIGYTPSMPALQIRPDEISAWLGEHAALFTEPVEAFVILDDDYDMGDLTSRAVQVTSEYGLQAKDVDRAIQLFAEKTSLESVSTADLL